MPQPDVLIIRAPGTNCDQETAFAFERAGARTELLHINRLLEKPDLFGRFQILCIPGGFSYGDDVAAGRILANQIQHHLAEPMAQFKADGKLILGICNGFQVLTKSGVLLDGAAENGPPATLTYNDSGKFEDRWVRLRVQGSKSVFLTGIEAMYLPVAHAEGKFVTRDEETLGQLEAAGQLVLRYVSQRGGGERGSGERGSGERGSGERGSGERGSGERGSGERGSGEQSAGVESAGVESAGVESAGVESAGTSPAARWVVRLIRTIPTARWPTWRAFATRPDGCWD